MSEEIIKQGELKKWVNFMSGWKLRYFVLKGGILSYSSLKDQKQKGQIIINQQTKIIQPDIDPLRIDIIQGKKSIQFRTANKEEKTQWLNTLKVVQDMKKSDESEDINELSKKKFTQRLQQIWETQANFDREFRILQEKLTKDPVYNSIIVKVGEEFNTLIKIVSCLVVDVESEKRNLVKQIRQLEDQLKKDQNGVQQQFETIQQQSVDSSQEDNAEATISSELITKSEQISQQIQQVKEQSEIQQTLSKLENLENSNDLEISQNIQKSQHSLKQLILEYEIFKSLQITEDRKRDKLLGIKDPSEKLNIWGALKDSVGKDMSKLSVPITLNEPLSMLQRLCEQFEYADILSKTVSIEDSCLRMAYVMGFAFSYYSSSLGRLRKPFNPLLGETYEYENETLGIKYIAEQVSHHPPVSAVHCECPLFKYWGSAHIKTAFYGKSMDFKPLGNSNLYLNAHGDQFVYNHAQSSLENLLLGKMYLENSGEITFQNITTGDYGMIELKKRGWGGSGAFEAKGYIKDKTSETKYKIEGKWDSTLKAINESTKEQIVLWEINKPFENYEQYYYFTDFALQLNHINKSILDKIPPTDSRLRPDQRALEIGNVLVATQEKERLEQKQREKKKYYEENSIAYSPNWFVQGVDSHSGEKTFFYSNNYWETKTTRNYDDSQNIF